jgi:hypothetical protein
MLKECKQKRHFNNIKKALFKTVHGMKHQITRNTLHVLRILCSGHLACYLYENEFRSVWQLPQCIDMDNTYTSLRRKRNIVENNNDKIYFTFLHSVHCDIFITNKTNTYLMS